MSRESWLLLLLYASALGRGSQQPPALRRFVNPSHPMYSNYHLGKVHAHIGFQLQSPGAASRGQPDQITVSSYQPLLSKIQLPREYDVRETLQGQRCYSVQKVRKQRLGTCWAVAATATISDRLCLATSGEFNKAMSTPAAMLDCETCFMIRNKCHRFLKGLLGGYPERLWQYYADLRGTEHLRSSTDEYADLNSKIDEVLGDLYQLSVRDSKDLPMMVECMKAEIFMFGPISGYLLFGENEGKAYQSYSSNSNPLRGEDLKYEYSIAHAIEIIGWKDNPEEGKVWVVKNSYGRFLWGKRGYGHVVMGENALGIEQSVLGGGLRNYLQ